MEQKLDGNWKIGWALDLHTISSVKTENGGYDTTYTTIGKALYELKYHQDKNHLDYLSQELINFMNTRKVTRYLDVIIPVPPSNLERTFQPVYELGLRLAEKIDVPINFEYLLKNSSTSQLKSIDNSDEREKALTGVFSLKNPNLYKGKKVLLFDDLYRSGTTLREITRVLYQSGGVSNVYVVTLTKTRVKR